MEDLLFETYRVLNRVREAGVTPASVQAVMGSREAVQTLARRMPGMVRKTGLALDLLAAEFGPGFDGEALYQHLIDCPRRPELIAKMNREMEEFFGTPDQADSFFEASWPEAELAACPF
jgi:hypothetical protein